MKSNKKENELKCIELVLAGRTVDEFSKSLLNELRSNEICQGERPDFTIGKIGIEHFQIDVISGTKHKKAMSIDRMNQAQMTEKIEYYKDNDEKLLCDIDNGKATSFLNGIINSRLNGISSFNHQEYVRNFRRIYREHYSSVDVYKEKCREIGFLIEIPFIDTIGKHGYIVENKGKKRYQSISSLPISIDIIKEIRLSGKLDFVIICLRPLCTDYKTTKRKAKIYYLDIENIDECIRKQKIIICDRFDFPVKIKNKNPISITASKI